MSYVHDPVDHASIAALALASHRANGQLIEQRNELLRLLQEAIGGLEAWDLQDALVAEARAYIATIEDES